MTSPDVEVQTQLRSDYVGIKGRLRWIIDHVGQYTSLDSVTRFGAVLGGGYAGLTVIGTKEGMALGVGVGLLTRDFAASIVNQAKRLRLPRLVW